MTIVWFVWLAVLISAAIASEILRLIIIVVPTVQGTTVTVAENGPYWWSFKTILESLLVDEAWVK